MCVPRSSDAPTPGLASGATINAQRGARAMYELHSRLYARLRLLTLIVVPLVAGCGDDDAPAPQPSPAASSGTTPITSPSTFPAADPETGARASGGVFDAPTTQPPSR